MNTMYEQEKSIQMLNKNLLFRTVFISKPIVSYRLRKFFVTQARVPMSGWMLVNLSFIPGHKELGIMKTLSSFEAALDMDEWRHESGYSGSAPVA